MRLTLSPQAVILIVTLSPEKLFTQITWKNFAAFSIPFLSTRYWQQKSLTFWASSDKGICFSYSPNHCQSIFSAIASLSTCTCEYLQSAHQVLFHALDSPYLLRDYHRATGLLPVPHKEGVSVHLWACSHKSKVQEEKSIRSINCLTYWFCYTYFCILSLMSRMGLLSPPPDQTQLVHCCHCSSIWTTLQKNTVSECSLKITMSSREGTGCNCPVRTPSKTANSIFQR